MTAYRSLQELFAAQAVRRPTATALRSSSGELTYEELRAAAAAITVDLREVCPDPGQRIGLEVKRGPETVVGILGILGAGHAYVPLDPDYPRDRLEFIVEDAQLAALVTSRPAKRTSIPMVRLFSGQRSAETEFINTSPSATAYMMYTSGSTGRPKGVLVSHANVLALITAAVQTFAVAEEDTVSVFHSHAFDPSVLEMWQALGAGASIFAVTAEQARDPTLLLEALEFGSVTVLTLVPAVLRHVARAVDPQAPPGLKLRVVLIGGEPIDAHALRIIRACSPAHCRFFNLYGATETTVVVTYHEISSGELDSSRMINCIGRALPGVDVELIGDDGRPVAPGAPGEIYVAGAAVAAGYHRRLELTRERFLKRDWTGQLRPTFRTGDFATRNSEGELVFCGRQDDMVKISGFRIHLGEVEIALRALAGIEDVIVLRAEGSSGEAILIASYIGEPMTTRELRRKAHEVLPPHMVPARFEHVDGALQGPSGKAHRSPVVARA